MQYKNDIVKWQLLKQIINSEELEGKFALITVIQCTELLPLSLLWEALISSLELMCFQQQPHPLFLPSESAQVVYIPRRRYLQNSYAMSLFHLMVYLENIKWFFLWSTHCTHMHSCAFNFPLLSIINSFDTNLLNASTGDTQTCFNKYFQTINIKQNLFLVVSCWD
jgi:hypothetical protein